jgi:hypothetical protein
VFNKLRVVRCRCGPASIKAVRLTRSQWHGQDALEDESIQLCCPF